MFEKGTRYSIQSVAFPLLTGYVDIISDENDHRWEVVARIAMPYEYCVTLSRSSFIDRLTDLWETPEGYIHFVSAYHYKSPTFITNMSAFLCANELIIENVSITYPDNLDVIERIAKS
jgi:hypothetical protein